MNALAPIQADEFEVVQRTARMLAISAYFDAKGDTPVAIAQVATKILAGRELGFGPFAAVNGIHIIQGKPAVGANLMASAVKGSGRYDYRVKKMADDEVVLEFFAVAGSKRESLGESSFSVKDAQAAGVTGNPTWKKFPRNMLFARAMSNGVRWYTPDVFSGNAVYVPEELGATVDDQGDVIEVTGRMVQPATGEIVSPAPRPGVGADVDMGMGASDDNPFVEGAPWYILARDSAQNGIGKLCDTMRNLHVDSNGPCTAKQYGYLVSLINKVAGDDAHKRILPVLCQSEISHNNLPGKNLVAELLKRLATQIKDGASGEYVDNPDYDERYTKAMPIIYKLAESVGTPSLFDA